MPSAPATTRFAPSPTGWLHLGHAFAAWWAWQRARRSAGSFLLRIEDIDSGRIRPEYEQGILGDLTWLGLDWDGPVVRQSDRLTAHAAALARLDALGLLYPCFCTRREIQEEIARSGGAPHGPDGPLYPGTCRSLSPADRQARILAGLPFVHRLDAAAASAAAGPLHWQDLRTGRHTVDAALLGDVVLARKDAGSSYHLAVTVDDAHQHVSLVTRGEDLHAATHVHRLLQALLDLPVPDWEHHPLARDESGTRLAKRDNARAIRTLRDLGWSPAQVLQAARRAAGHTDE